MLPAPASADARLLCPGDSSVHPYLGLRASAGFGWWCLLLWWLATVELVAAVTVRSRSGQFIIHSSRPTTPSLSQITPVSTNRVLLLTLQPDPLAVSCERIKSAMLAELGAPDRWRGKIHVTIDPRGKPVLFPTTVAVRYADGWQYSLRLPQEIEGRALVRGVVHALLTEIANQNPGPGAPELPVWLVEALAGQILNRVGPDPLAQLNPVTGRYATGIGQLQAALRERKPADELQNLLRLLQSRPLPSFEELSLPAAEQLEGEALTHYGACAQLLFASLRELPGGSRCFAIMLAELPRRLNWQTAFLAGFQRHFPRMLDVEKWWALAAQRLRPFSGQPVLSPATGLLWIEDLLSVPVEVQPGPGLAAERRVVPLQTVVVEWDPPLQPRILGLRERQLRQLALSLPPEPQALAVAYADALKGYLDRRSRAGTRPSLHGIGAYQVGQAVRTAVARLDALDAERLELRARLGRTEIQPAPASP